MNWLYFVFIEHKEAPFVLLLIIAICYFLLCLLCNIEYGIKNKSQPRTKDNNSFLIKTLLWTLGFVIVSLVVMISVKPIKHPTLSKAIYYVEHVEHKGKHYSTYTKCINDLNISLAQYQTLNKSKQMNLDNKLIDCLRSNYVN